MQEEITPARQIHPPVSGATPDHGITITQLEDPITRRTPTTSPFRASCLCGWESPIVPSRARAAADGEAHLIRATVTDTAPTVRESVERRRAIRYQATDVEGEPFDLFVADDEADPFIDACPAWCEDAARHRIEGSDVDRSHYGRRISVPLRGLPAQYEPADGTAPSGYVVGSATLYLRRNVLHRVPIIYVGKGEDAGFELDLNEAATIGRALLKLVNQAGDGRVVRRGER